MIKVAIVKCSNDKTCFVKIPRNWWKLLSQCEEHIFEIQKDEILAYLSWNGRTTLADNIIEINREYCSCLGFAENDEVSLKEVTQTIANCKEAILRPPNVDGFELIDLNKETIELHLKKQITIIWEAQVFPLWINNIQVLVEVRNTLPCQFAVKLVNETALSIDVNSSSNQPEVNTLMKRRMNNSDPYGETSRFSSLHGMMNALRNKWLRFTEIDYEDQSLHQEEHVKLLSEMPISLSLRVNPAEDILFISECALHFEVNCKLRGVKYPSTVYVSSAVLPNNGKKIPEMFLAKISKLLSPLEKTENKSSDKKGRSMFERRKNNFSSMNKESDSLNEAKYFSSSIVQVIVLNDIERSCNNCIGDKLNIALESGSIIIPDCLRKMLGLEIASRVHIQSIDYMPSTLDTIHFYPVLPLEQSLAENVTSVFISWLETVYTQFLPFIFCNGSVVTFPIHDDAVDFVLMASLSQDNGSSSFVSAEKDDSLRTYWKISPSILSKNISCKLESVLTPVKVNGIALPSPSLCLIDDKLMGPDLVCLGGIETVSKKGLQFLELWLNISPISKSLCLAKEHNAATLLICGPRGGGKTTLCQALCKKISQSPYYVYCHFISCRSLKGKRGETLWKTWQKSCSDVIHREPAVLVVDDLDVIVSAPTTPEEEVSSNGIYFQKIVHTFLNLCDYIKSSGAKVTVIATAKSFRSIHPLLASTRGEHVFQYQIEINCPTKDQREEILKAIVESKLNIKLNDSSLFHKLASKTEGYVARDLDTLLNRATHAALMRSDQAEALHECKLTEICLMEADFNAAFRNFIPSSLQSVHLHKSGTKQWHDIGGLSDVKDTLHKILLWPAKYPFLFANCPLRLQSGILLYGPPGTGKTLIAGVLAKESGLNFIHIKGPELLSKYIGASEQALRNSFQNAQNAKPCILFFDEFDALAPRRGHDSTGVTDRVVNQMLTQMDGVESLNGVYILAATSRPDLIDPALLRPGRLDKHLYCPLPNEDDRLQILRALSRKLCLSDDVDLPAIAALTPDFSGADLQALLYSAQIESLRQIQNNTNQEKDVLGSNEDSPMEYETIYFPSIEIGPITLDPGKQQIIKNEIAIIQKNNSNNEQIKARDPDDKPSLCINHKNLIAAFDKMRPSVSAIERAKYQFIYSRFGRGGADVTTLADFGGKRVTLA